MASQRNARKGTKATAKKAAPRSKGPSKPVPLARAHKPAPKPAKPARTTRTSARKARVAVTRAAVTAASQPADVRSPRTGPQQLTLAAPMAADAGPAPERVPLSKALAPFRQGAPADAATQESATATQERKPSPPMPELRTNIWVVSRSEPEFEPAPRRRNPAAAPAATASPQPPVDEAASGGWSPPTAPTELTPPARSARSGRPSPPAAPRAKLVARAPRPGAPEVADPTTPLRCKSWRTEAILRMLENNLHNAEEPEKLIVYGGTGKAARNPESLAAIKATLEGLADDETMLVQSGKPVAVFRTWPHAPRVLIANSHLVPRWSTWEAFNELEAAGLTMYGQMTAGSWCYIGTQGIIQGTYETFAQAARTHFGPTATLRHRIVLTAGLGGMGGAQPRAVTMNGGVCLAIEVDPARAKRRKDAGFIDIVAPDLATGRDLAQRAARSGEPLAIAVIANAAEAFPALLADGFAPHIVTDQTSAHDPLSYVPAGYSVAQSAALKEADPGQHRANAYQSMARHVHAMVGFLNQGSHVFDYGNNLREGAVTGGLPRDAAYSFPGFVPAYIRPMFCEGRGPFRWISLRGDVRDIEKTEELLLSMFPENKVLTNWIHLARTTLPVEGLPARVCWLGMGERDRFALAMNELVASGAIGPIAVTRDHLDSGSVASPFRETESMHDGSDAIADWPILNAMVNIAAGADSVHLHNGGGVGIGYSTHAGMVVVLDGTELATQKASRVFQTDPGMGIVRHADAGYAKALEVAKATGVRTPLV